MRSKTLDEPGSASIGRPQSILGFLLALFVLPAIAASGLVTSELLGIGVKWIVAIALVIVVLRYEAKSLDSIGLVRPRPTDIVWVLAVVVGVVGMFLLTGPLIAALGLRTQLGASMPSLTVGLVSAVTAGITEELLFRGYPIERLTDAGFGPLVAGGVTWFLFSVAHLGAGYPAGNLLQIGLAGLIITGIYVHVRSLVPVIIGHVVVDIVGVLLFFFG